MQEARVLELREARLGPVTLNAPDVAPRQFVGSHGHMWQWVGDGMLLLNLSVAVRTSVLGRTRSGVPHHLNWEVRRLSRALSADPAPRVEQRAVWVSGASDAAYTVVDGVRDGIEVRGGVVVSTAGDWMHVTQLTATDTSEGRALVEDVLGELQVFEWRMPA